MRYPVLWEHVAPEGLERADWAWTDERVARLRDLGIRPILGLLHHGSGPRSTSLVDPEFPEKLAAFARAVAERYPWAEDWTPVNEPLTTARFSGLYGHWYPHGRDDRTFVRALLNQCRAVVLAMRAVREVIPGARLVQTDDLGKTFSTPRLAYQAAWENERRWLTFDLLTGRLDEHAALWPYLTWAGATEEDLRRFVDDPCPPDVVGINHYLSSERFIDERLERYPPDSHGGNGRDAYADVLAARVVVEGAAGPEALLREAWERYRLPLAVTEAHNGCTRDEQLRWLDEVWRGAETLLAEGADVRAVSVWSLLGAFDWATLSTTTDGYYEPGAFDVRGPAPRPTAIVAMTRALADGRRYEHPVLATPGWWRRPERLFFPAVCIDGGAPPSVPEPPHDAQPILVSGARGTLGQAFARLCDARGLEHRLLTRQEMDIADAEAVRRAFERFRPWAVVNASGYVRVDDAEAEEERCLRENARGPEILARACAGSGVALVTFSSDLVFDGRSDRPYVESDPVAPLNAYGRSKA